MFKTFAAALVAASVIAAPVLAQGTASKPGTPATEMTKAPEAKGAVKTVKAKKHAIKKHVIKKQVAVNHIKHRKPIKAAGASNTMKHVRHAKNGRHHVKQAAAKPAVTKPAPVTTTGSAPKTNAN